jgi:hypothetical protein
MRGTKKRNGWWTPLSDLFDSASKAADSTTDELFGAVPPFDNGTDEPLEGKNVRCFLCGQPVAVKLTKKKRPYWQCRNCWVQVFVRGDTGIKRFRQWLDTPGKAES